MKMMMMMSPSEQRFAMQRMQFVRANFKREFIWEELRKEYESMAEAQNRS